MKRKFIPIASPHLNSNERKYVLDCIKSTWISSTGSYIDRFEKAFAKRHHMPYALSCSNGTAALHLALLALGIGKDDEVIVPVFTFVSSVNVIAYVGATPVFVDIDETTWNIDVKKIEEKVTSKTKAIIVVHLYGSPANMDEVKRIAKKHKLAIIEDAAEAHFALYENKLIGTLGDIACFSFYGNKIITTGEGGMILTRSKALAEKVDLFKNHGMARNQKYFHPVIGYNYRMTNLQAAIGYAQMKNIQKFLRARKKIAKQYNRMLSKIKGITLQRFEKNATPVTWLYSILITEEFGCTRDQCITRLKEFAIDSRPFFHLINEFPMYKDAHTYPVAQRISKLGINLPTWVGLTKTDITYIANTLQKIQKKYDQTTHK